MEQNITKQFAATRAVIVRDGKVLIIRESSKYDGGTQIGLYDFPGGKIKPGEHPHEALDREVLEEAGMKVRILKPFFVEDWMPTVKGETIHVVAVFFLCEPESETVTLGPDFDDYKWISPAERNDYPLMIENIWALEELEKQKLLEGI